ncbi:MAG: hypothetical protein DRP78_01580 [Candidatus Omnitrophota bacterium]|nr:MAG: hypothetical protein DRP78_01580 [Candidatus Omnitrophota bacterium]
MGKISDFFKNTQIKQFNGLSLPSLPRQFVLKSVNDANINPHIVTYFYPKSPISEQYRRLRENIKSLSRQKNIKAIGITSAVTEEGKSITALNLAVIMTRDIDFNNILLIDCDLRCGVVDLALGLKSKTGLSEYLSIGTDIDNILFKTKIDKLTVMPKGSIIENPSELLASEKMQTLLAILRKRFDLIILDTPPILPIADAGVVGAQVDGMILVVRLGKTQKGMVEQAEELLVQSKVNLLGYVLTHVEYHIPEYVYKYV